ncbi:MAG: cytochrome c biogenesis protein CcsA [Gemmatirosa sp.]|nr:cytochrome c biogenesis protein CcsA [Gemmatirosa sp.]
MTHSATHTAPTTAPRLDAPLARGGPDLLLGAAVVAVAAAIVRAIYFTPMDSVQGPAQKIFYVHVSSAIVALYVAFALLAITSGVYLWLRDERVDRMAESAAEVGLVFMSAVLLSGPLWGKPIWGTFWTWDARLTLTLFTWLIVLGYLTMRGAIEDREQRARFSAVLGILAGLLVPFIHLATTMFRTLHPQPILLKPGAPSMSHEMLMTWLYAQCAFVLLFVALMRSRYRYGVERDELARLRGEDV